jgi:hypothetical protein
MRTPFGSQPSAANNQRNDSQWGAGNWAYSRSPSTSPPAPAAVPSRPSPGQANPIAPKSQGTPYQAYAPQAAPRQTATGNPQGAYAAAPANQRPPDFQMGVAQTPWGQSMDPFVERNAFINQINQQRMQNQLAFNTGGPTNPAAGLTPGLNYQQAMQQAGLGNGAPSMSPNYGDSMISRLNQAFGAPAGQQPNSFQPFVNNQGQKFTGTMSFAPGTPQEYQNQAYTNYANKNGFYQPTGPAATQSAGQPLAGSPLRTVNLKSSAGASSQPQQNDPNERPGDGPPAGSGNSLPRAGQARTIQVPSQGAPYQTVQQGGFKYDKDPTLGNAEFQRWLDIKSPARTTLYDRAANERMYDQFLAEEEKPPVRPPVQGPTRPVVTERPGQARPIEVQLTGEERRRALIAPRQYSPEEAAQRQRIADLRKEADQLTAPKAPKYDLTDYYRKLPSGMKGSRPPQRS